MREFIEPTWCGMLNLIFLFLVFGLCHGRTSSDLKVRIEDGRVIGRYLTSESGRTIRAFMGIPYAEPPVGKLRFKAPSKVKQWMGILMAQSEPPKCTQIDPYSRSKTVEGQEDCLYVNVYAPKVRWTCLFAHKHFLIFRVPHSRSCQINPINCR